MIISTITLSITRSNFFAICSLLTFHKHSPFLQTQPFGLCIEGHNRRCNSTVKSILAFFRIVSIGKIPTRGARFRRAKLLKNYVTDFSAKYNYTIFDFNLQYIIPFFLHNPQKNRAVKL